MCLHACVRDSVRAFACGSLYCMNEIAAMWNSNFIYL